MVVVRVCGVRVAHAGARGEAGYGCARALEAMVDGGARRRRRRPLSRYREVAGTLRLRARGGDRVCARGRVCMCVFVVIVCVWHLHVGDDHKCRHLCV